MKAGASLSVSSAQDMLAERPMGFADPVGPSSFTPVPPLPMVPQPDQSPLTGLTFDGTHLRLATRQTIRISMDVSLRR
jgi:hypothetical protein